MASFSIPNGPEIEHLKGFATVSPNELLTNSEYNTSDEAENEELCYATLTFPDSTYRLKHLTAIIGRNVEAQRYIEENAQFWIDGKRLRRPQSSISREGLNESGQESEGDRSDSGYGGEPQEDYGDRMTAEGGIGAMQPDLLSKDELGQDEDLIYVHPPADLDNGEVPKLNAISKRHLKIAFREDFGWTLKVLGRNGAYHNDCYLHHDAEVELVDNDDITIAGLSIKFNTAPGAEEDEDEDSEEDSESDGSVSGSNEVQSGRSATVDSEEGGLGDGLDEDENTPPTSPQKARIKQKHKDKPSLKLKVSSTAKITKKKDPAKGEHETSTDTPQKRKGPGRPPADGIMSKRERREREKAAKLGLNYGDALPSKVKVKSGRDTNEDGEDGDNSAKKIKKRKRENTLTDGGDEASNSKHEIPRPPSPKESDYTAEQLKRPDGTYQPLIYEVLSEAKAPLALPQIYEAFKRKWPYFKFKAKTSGWESSVRHNLTPNGIFKQDGRAGKGHLWTINPDVPFEPKVKRAHATDHASNPSFSNSYQYRPLPIHGQSSGKTQSSQYSQLHAHTYQRSHALSNGSNLQGQPNGATYPMTYSSSQLRTHQQPPTNLPQMRGTPPNGLPANHVSSRPPTSSYTSQQSSSLGTRPATTTTSALSGNQSSSSNSARPSSSVQQQSSRPLSGASSSRALSAAEQLQNGQTPELFIRFKNQLHGMFPKEEERQQMNEQVDRAIAWIKSHPSGDNGVQHQDQHVRGIIEILRNMVREDTKAPMAKRAPQTSGSSAQTISSQSRPSTPQTAATAPASNNQPQQGASANAATVQGKDITPNQANEKAAGISSTDAANRDTPKG